jgi:hypothetical protein
MHHAQIDVFVTPFEKGSRIEIVENFFDDHFFGGI